jgi:Papain family cysteine protease
MNENDIVTLPNGLDAVVIGGEPRVLAKLAPDPVKRAAFPPFLTAAPTVPRSEWKDIDRRTYFDDDYMLDQRSNGSCVGFCSAHALMRLRAIEGQRPHVRLSGAFTYSLINGGRNDGAQISDSLATLMKVGTCPESMAPWDAIYPSRYKPEARVAAARFRILEAYKVNDFDELMSGIQLGFIGVGAVHVASRFSTLDRDGVCGFDRGPGNHAVTFQGAKRLPNGEWVLDMPNSWGRSFGENGHGYITEKHIESVIQDAYLIRAATSDPEGEQPPGAIP